jgi:EmrB/QacA subfamily drug resistance transporter
MCVEKRSLLLTASVGCALTIFDTNLVGVVLPSITAELQADFSEMAWVHSSFLLSFASLLLLAGAMGDRFGRKRVFMMGVSLFGVAAFLSGLAVNMPTLIAARALQGVGAALLLTPALSIIRHTFNQNTDAIKAWSIWGSMMGLTMMVAPLLSSFVGAFLGWRWAFFMMSAICALLILVALKTLEDSRAPKAGRFDWRGAGIFSIAMLLCVWSIINGPLMGWGSTPVIGAALAGGIGLLLFVYCELSSANPMLELRLFKSYTFVSGVIAMFAYAATAQVMAAIFPLYLQFGLGYSFVWLGVAMLPFALAMFVFPFVARRLALRVTSHQLLAIGLLVIALGNAALAFVASGESSWLFFMGMFLLGAGGGLINGETQKAILGSVAKEKAGMASGVSTTARFVGMLIGYAGWSAVLANGIKEALNTQLCRDVSCSLDIKSVEWVVTGQFREQGQPMLDQGLAIISYKAGFEWVFYGAAGVALMAALIAMSARTQHR